MASNPNMQRTKTVEQDVLFTDILHHVNTQHLTDIQLETIQKPEIIASPEKPADTIGLEPWMRRVLKGCAKVQRKSSPKAVHSLRVAIRRCRSMAEVLCEIDPDPQWSQMLKAGKDLMKGLGRLRDIQVMREWVEKLAPKEDPVGQAMLAILSEREETQKIKSIKVIKRFDAKAWAAWIKVLPERAKSVPLDGLVYEHMALECYSDAWSLHQRAMRNRSRAAYHQLRVGIKRFRYVVENFLPGRHEMWGRDLAEIQDLLGELHDLDVLSEDLRETGAIFNKAARKRWMTWIETERKARLEHYHQRMTGKQSLWLLWRAGLPEAERLGAAALAKLETWASFLDNDMAHARHVADLAIQIFDGLGKADVPGPFGDWRYRRILRAAALMHEVGGANGNGPQQVKASRRIRQLYPPLGWTPADIELAAHVVRYHWRDMPRNNQKGYAAMAAPDRESAPFLIGILRLANALDHYHDNSISLVDAAFVQETILIRAHGFECEGSLNTIVTGAKNLLELACDKPVVVHPAG